MVWIVSIPFKNSIYQISVVILPLLFFTDLYFTRGVATLKNIFRTYKDVTISLLIYHDRFKLSILQIGLLTIFTFIFIYDLLYSLSRASWVSFAVFVLCISALNYKKFNLKIIITLFLVLVLIILFVANDGSILARFNQLVQGDSSDRYYIWENSIKAFLQSPLFGYGLNSFKQVITVKYSATHNSILELLLFVDLVGFVAFSYMLYLLVREVYQHKDAIGFSFFTSLLVITQFDTSVTGSKIFLSILTVCAFYILSGKKVSSIKMA